MALSANCLCLDALTTPRLPQYPFIQLDGERHWAGLQHGPAHQTKSVKEHNHRHYLCILQDVIFSKLFHFHIRPLP